MLKLIRWQLREYRSVRVKVLLASVAVVAVAAGLSYTLLDFPTQFITVLRWVQLGTLGGLLMFHYYPYLQVRVIRDAHTLPLHVALPQGWSLMARVIASIPLLAAYIAVNALLYYALPPDFPQLQELSLLSSLVRAPRYLLGVALLMSALALRTVLRSVLAFPDRLRCVSRRAKWDRASSVALDAALLVGCSVLAGVLIAIMARVGAAHPAVEALVFTAAGFALTWLNGLLLDRYTPQLELL